MSEDNNSLGYASAPASGGNRGPSTSSAALTVADVLNRAADLVAAGWLQNRIHNGDVGEPTCYCALGAILQASRGGRLYIDADEALAKVIAADAPAHSHLRPVPAWNDAPGRTQAEVVAALREAASRATRDASPVSVTESLQARSRDSDGANQ